MESSEMELYDDLECNQCGWTFDEDEACRNDKGKLACPKCRSIDLTIL